MSIESTIKTFVMTFLKASKGRENMPEKDFQKLLGSQLKNVMAETDASSAVNEILEGAADKQEGKVGFKEFIDVLGCLATKLSEKLPVAAGTPADDTPADDTPAEDTSAEDTPPEDTPAEDTPPEDTPAEDTPAEDTPAEDTPPEDTES